MSTHTKHIIGILFLFLTGCASFDIAKSPASSLTPGFVAKKEYPVSSDKMWNTVRNVLEDERIPIATTDKTDGRITTEYVKGQQRMMVGLLGVAAFTLQHKYSIRINQVASSVRLKIIAIVEVLETEGAGWRPLGDEKEAKSLEDWLY